MVGSPRLRRLYADYQAVREHFTGHPHIQVRPLYGNPPEAYEIVYRVPGVVLDPASNRPIISNEHRARIYLHREYPREKPKCVMETPIFHPNIGSYICIDDYWAAGETLVDIIIHIGQMIQYQNYNPRSPLNPVAARWASTHEHIFPVGNVDLYPPELEIDLVGDSGPCADLTEESQRANDSPSQDLEIELL
jgi:ubiquitin-protein ligase